jgi:hypothetical protein
MTEKRQKLIDRFDKWLESKVKNCHNTNTIFDTRNYVLLDDVRKLIAAINYTPCCKSDSEQLKDEEIPKIDDWIKDLGYTQITFSYVYKNGGTYKDREQLCKEYKKEFCL